jgi:hypothetical protein
MSGRLLEVALRPTRIAFLLGRNPSNRLINSIVSVNSGLWGGICNLICPTDGASLSDEYLELLQKSDPDCILFCGRFNNRQNILHQLEEHYIHPSFLFKNISMARIETFGIGIEGIFDSRFLQNWQRGLLTETAMVDPRIGSTTILDKLMFGIPPNRIKSQISGYIDFISVNRCNRESKRSDSEYDEIIGIIQITRENIERYRVAQGRRFIAVRNVIRGPYFVLGRKDNLDDACYFWNIRAILGTDMVEWVDLSDLPSFLEKREKVSRPHTGIRTSVTAITENHRKYFDTLVKGTKARGKPISFSSAKATFRLSQNWTWKSEIRRDHLPVTGGEFVIPVRRPSSFRLDYPRRYPRWVMDCRIVRDDVIGTEGFVLPDLPYLANLMVPVRSERLRPRILGDVFSLQVTSAPIDENIRLKIPTDWEIIQLICSQSHHNICLSDQGNYMNRAISLFGGLGKLSSLLRDKRVVTIFNQFLRHHHTGEGVIKDGQYRRALMLSDMEEAIMSLNRTRTRKKRAEVSAFIDQLLRTLIQAGAVYSGYVLDCPDCNLEEWYPISEVTETFRCRRCLTVQTRPPNPSIFFRLNEALYQAYLNNFAVPALVLEVLHNSSRASFIFSPQIKLEATDVYSPEVDIVAICDGKLSIGEAKSTNRIKQEQFSALETIALGVSAKQIIFGTTSRESCHDCESCSKQMHYADNSFGHGSTRDPRRWGTRERIKDLRERLRTQGIQVTSVCAEDILQGAIQRNRFSPILIPTTRRTA